MTALALADPILGIGHMLSHPFFARAFLAGSLIAAACGLVGYFVVLRGQVFTGDALSHVAFTGSLAALAFGIDLRVGLFVGCVLFALAMAGLGRKARADDVVIGSVFAWVLGLGVLFLALYTSSVRGGDGGAGPSVLFGSIFGLSANQAAVGAVVAGGVILVMALIGRPLLFASIDADVAGARGVPVRWLGVGFLAVVGVTAGEATQAVGALLLLGLLAAPAGAAVRLTSRPWAGALAAVGLAVASMWVGLAWSYAVASLPPSFTIVTCATASYAAAMAWDLWRRAPRRSRSSVAEAPRARARLVGDEPAAAARSGSSHGRR